MVFDVKGLALRGLKWSVVDKLFNQAAVFLVTIYLARILGPESFGLIGMLNIFIVLSDSLIKNGLSQAIIQQSYNLTTDDESTAFFTNIFIALVLYTTLFLLAPWLADFYGEDELILASRVLFLVILISSISVVPRAKLSIAVDFRSQAISSGIATLLGSAVALFLAHFNYGYWSLIALTLVNGFTSTLLLWFFCKWRPKVLFSINSFRKLSKFGINIMIAGFVATLVNNLYVMLIGRFYNTAQVGYFTQASNLTGMLSGVMASVIQNVTFPILSSVKEDQDRLVLMYTNMVKMTTIFTLPFLIGFAAVSDLFTILFLGEEWLEIVPLLVVLSFARAFTPINSMNMNILNAIGRSDRYLIVDLVKLPITLGALFIAIPYGIEGVANAIFVTTTVSFFINAYYPGKYFGFGAITQIKHLYKIVLSALIMYICIKFVSIDGLGVELVTKILVGMFVYPVALVALRVPLKTVWA